MVFAPKRCQIADDIKATNYSDLFTAEGANLSWWISSDEFHM